MAKYNYYAERIVPLLVQEAVILEEESEEFLDFIKDTGLEEN